ncbi:MAG: hypothetical protein QM805_23645 [Pseudomonas sp.]
MQERERQTNDKEERLRQLENHLKEAKTNLDRMAAENNRLLAERSEGVKELARSVHLREHSHHQTAPSRSSWSNSASMSRLATCVLVPASWMSERAPSSARARSWAFRLKKIWQSAKDKFSTIVQSLRDGAVQQHLVRYFQNGHRVTGGRHAGGGAKVSAAVGAGTTGDAETWCCRASSVASAACPLG